MKKISSFLFPIKNPITLTAMGGMMLALRLFIGVFSIKLGPTVLSFSWLSLYLAGFILGPIIGYLFGWITDSVSYGIRGGVYMWEYAIQESFIVLIGGLCATMYHILKQYKSKWTMFIIFEVVFTTMMIFSFYMLLKYFDFSHVAKNGGDQKWIDSKLIKIFGLILAATFYVLINGFIIYKVIRNNNANLLIFASLAVIISWIVFSWIIGPWAQVRYLEKLTGHTSKGYQEYGYKWYALSRILKSMFTVPIEISITYLLWKAYEVWMKTSRISNHF
ncbi:hypothetical protein [Candidatus Mycoplasma mahonii]|uniref:hypothetical protein n=1 Tax=Candidatus Mycoplasma mahonii TaxID=3004105 RepID=UPI0026ED68C9|nr:hypothetical protein [Candidatus Mycoplasma mahonii]WKX02664.1 hypothetical protein O3I44_01125 [Candidatus Mycoplasma mahonii]